jgi:23S rRNA-/tRNA-specific pseudouridylate synthase
MHLHPCHRLDRDTTGVLVFAKGKAKQKVVMELFATRQTVKIYICVVNGLPGVDSGTMKGYIDGKSALTQYQVMYRGPNYAVLKCKLHTGRTNQIRIHCANLGHPLVGDDKFGRRKEFAFAAKRTLLHAQYLSFPWKGSLVEYKAPLPQDILSVWPEIVSPTST